MSSSIIEVTNAVPVAEPAQAQDHLLAWSGESRLNDILYTGGDVIEFVTANQRVSNGYVVLSSEKTAGGEVVLLGCACVERTHCARRMKLRFLHNQGNSEWYVMQSYGGDCASGILIPINGSNNKGDNNDGTAIVKEDNTPLGCAKRCMNSWAACLCCCCICCSAGCKIFLDGGD